MDFCRASATDGRSSALAAASRPRKLSRLDQEGRVTTRSKPRVDFHASQGHNELFVQGHNEGQSYPDEIILHPTGNHRDVLTFKLAR
jgi:hypothetical protein